MTYAKLSRLRNISMIVLISLLLGSSLAQDLSQKAITLASSHAAFSNVLTANEGWSAEAFDTQNVYGIWRVQFWDAERNDLGWVDLNPAKDKVYAWDYHTEVSDKERELVSQPILEFLNAQTDITDLVGILEAKDLRISYHNGHRHWRVRIDRKQNTVHVVLIPEITAARSLQGLELRHVSFENIPSYEDWRSGNEANLVAIAFQETAIAAVLRGKENWVTQVKPSDNQNWQVSFLEGDTVLALAEVNPFEARVLRFEVTP